VVFWDGWDNVGGLNGPIRSGSARESAYCHEARSSLVFVGVWFVLENCESARAKATRLRERATRVVAESF